MKEQEKIYELLDEFVMATHGHDHALMIDDHKAQNYYIRRLRLAVEGMLAVHPDAILVLEPLARDEDTFMAVEAAGYLSLHRPDVGLPLLNHLHDTIIGKYECVYAGFWLSRCEEEAKQAAQAASGEGEPTD